MFISAHGSKAPEGSCDFAQCYNLLSEVWECCLDPYWMVWMLARAGHNDERGLRQFACQAVRLFLWDFVVDDRSRKAVEDAERFAAGKATREEL